MSFRDDHLEHFAACGTTLPPADASGHVSHDGARIWYASYGAGPAVILLHGGLGNGGNFAPSLFVGAFVGFLFSSIITDLGVPGKIQKVSLQDVIEVASRQEPKMTLIMRELISRI